MRDAGDFCIIFSFWIAALACAICYGIPSLFKYNVMVFAGTWFGLVLLGLLLRELE